jgi:uncharacterized LabA/DUF88 family protein
MADRSAVFIDNGFFKIVQTRLNIRADYLSFSSAVVGGAQNRFRTYVYDCPPYQSNPPTKLESEKKASFDKFKFNITRLTRFEFRMGHLQLVRDEEGDMIKKKDGEPVLRQKGVDMALGIDMASLSVGNKIDKAIIVAGDSDFAPAVQVAKQAGVIVTLYYDSKTYVHNSLFDICDERIELTKEFLQKVSRE